MSDGELRHHHRRRGFGRLRAGRAARRGCSDGAFWCWRPAARTTLAHPSSARRRQGVEQSALELELRRRARAACRQPPHLSSARQGGGRLVVDQHHGLCALPSAAITTGCRSSGSRAGPTPTCCPTSSAPRASRAAAVTIAAAHGPLEDAHEPGARTRSMTRSSPPRPNSATASTTTINAAEQEGFGRLQHTIGNGRRSARPSRICARRWGAATITLLTRAHATQILFEGRRAAGIEYVQDGQKHEARADGEVILAGGAYNSPQLLMLSGIGPAEELRGLGIAPRVDLAGRRQESVGPPELATQWLRAKEGSFHRGLRLDRLAVSLAQAYLFGTASRRAARHRHRLHRQRAWARGARPAIFLRRRRLPRARMVPGSEAADARRVRPDLLPSAAGKSRRRDARLRRSAGAAAHLQQFPLDRL